MPQSQAQQENPGAMLHVSLRRAIERFRRGVAAGIAIGSALTAGAGLARAESCGLYHMPSRFSQYLGWGYGAGHHVPIVKTPAHARPWASPCAFPAAVSPPLYPVAYQPLRCSHEAYYGAALLPAGATIAGSAPATTVSPAPAAAGDHSIGP
ncbi:MAG: hypothetical protein DCC67_15435 [Planctomycetota bacterium]|nr:MAG: hypothetical protein DCC67_15435 [Planctomycetota bacterium]